MESTSGPTIIATVGEPLIDFFWIFRKHLSISVKAMIIGLQRQVFINNQISMFPAF